VRRALAPLIVVLAIIIFAPALMLWRPDAIFGAR
jgi:hypothetical protein